MALNNANNVSSSSVHIGSQSASIVIPAIYFPKKVALRSVDYMDGAAIAQDLTNFVEVKLLNGSTVLAKLDTSVVGADVAANVAKQLVAQVAPESGSQGGVDLAGPALPNEYPIEVAAGSSLKAQYVKHGTAVLTDGKLVLSYYSL